MDDYIREWRPLDEDEVDGKKKIMSMGMMWRKRRKIGLMRMRRRMRVRMRVRQEREKEEEEEDAGCRHSGNDSGLLLLAANGRTTPGKATPPQHTAPRRKTGNNNSGDEARAWQENNWGEKKRLPDWNPWATKSIREHQPEIRKSGAKSFSPEKINWMLQQKVLILIVWIMRQYFDATSKRLAIAGFSNIDELQVFWKANHIYNKYFQKFIKFNYSAKLIIFQKFTVAITVKQ